MADRRYAFEDGYADKSGAIVKSRIPNVFLECYRQTSGGKSVSPIYVRNLIGIYNDVLEVGATVERLLADRRYACGDSYAGKAGATTERVGANRRYAFCEGYAGKAGIAFVRRIKSIIPHVFLECYRQIIGGKYVSPIYVRNFIGIYNDVLEVGANPECLNADRRYVFGDGYAGKAGATVERAVADRRYVFGDSYAGKAGATVEHLAVDSCYAIGDG